MVQASLSVFACINIDDGTGPYGHLQLVSHTRATDPLRVSLEAQHKLDMA